MDKVDVLEYLKTLMEELRVVEKDISLLKNKYVELENEIAMFRYNFNISDEEINEVYGGDYDGANAIKRD